MWTVVYEDKYQTSCGTYTFSDLEAAEKLKAELSPLYNVYIIKNIDLYPAITDAQDVPCSGTL